MIVRLPWPHPALAPNRAKGMHWGSLVKLRKQAHDDAYMLTKAQPRRDYGEGNIAVSIVFAMPDKRGRDLDNLLSSCKNALDGVAAALGVDDKRFRPILIDAVPGSGVGAVIVAIGVKINEVRDL